MTVARKGSSLLPAPDHCVGLRATVRGTVTGSAGSKVQFVETTARVPAENNSTARAHNAAILAAFTTGIDPKKINDATVGEMISLLNAADGWVRLWVAGEMISGCWMTRNAFDTESTRVITRTRVRSSARRKGVGSICLCGA